MTRERTTAKRWGMFALLALLIAAFFHRAIAGQRFYAVDFYQTFVPLRAILTEAWKSGLPLWTGRLGNGSPVLANPAYGVLYPPNLLALGAEPSRALTLLTVAHALFGAVGAFALARRWGQSRSAAWVAAVCFSLGGPAVSATAYLNLAWPMGWLPWAVLAADEAFRSRTARAMLGVAVSWFSMFSMGDPVVLGAAIAGTGLIALGDVLRERREGRSGEIGRGLGALAAAAALALTLALPLLIAVARYAPTSVRGAGFKTEGILQWSLHPILLAGTVLSDAFGNPNLDGAGGFWALGLALDHGQPLLAGIYFGGLVVALLVLGSWERAPRRTMLLVWLALLLALALGKYGPIYPILNRIGFDALRFPTKWIVPALLPAGLLAGAGLDALGARMPGSPGFHRALAVFLGVLGMFAAISVAVSAGLDRRLAALSLHSGVAIDGVPLAAFVRTAWLSAATHAMLPVALAFAAWGAASKGGRRFAVLPSIATLVTADLALSNAHLAPTVTPDFYAVSPVAKSILDDPDGHARVWVDGIGGEPLQYKPPPRLARDTARPHRARLISYVGASAGLDLAFNGDTEAYSPATYARTEVLMSSAPLREKLMLLGAASVTHIVTFHTMDGPGLKVGASVPVGFNLPVLVYRNPFAVPRTRIVPRLTPYAGDAGFIEAVRSGSNDLFEHTALVERDELAASGVSAEAAAGEGGTAAITGEDSRSLSVAVSGGGGFLVVSDTLVRGWTATIDGAPAKLLRVDGAFRAVPVPAGTHRIDMRYDPW